METKLCQHCGGAIRFVRDTSSPAYMSPSRYARVLFCSNSCASLAKTTVEGDAAERRREHNRRYHAKQARLKIAHVANANLDWLAQTLNGVLAAWNSRRPI